MLILSKGCSTPVSDDSVTDFALDIIIAYNVTTLAIKWWLLTNISFIS